MKKSCINKTLYLVHVRWDIQKIDSCINYNWEEICLSKVSSRCIFTSTSKRNCLKKYAGLSNGMFVKSILENGKHRKTRGKVPQFISHLFEPRPVSQYCTAYTTEMEEISSIEMRNFDWIAVVTIFFYIQKKDRIRLRTIHFFSFCER